jgi:hypothetical protein
MFLNFVSRGTGFKLLVLPKVTPNSLEGTSITNYPNHAKGRFRGFLISVHQF